MVYVTQGELEQLVGENAGGVGEAKQTVVGEAGAQPHGAGVQDGLVAQGAQTGMAVNNLDALAQHNLAENGEEGEDRRHGRLAVDDEEGNVVHLEPVGQVSHARPRAVLVCDDDDLVPAIRQLRCQLVDVRFDAACEGAGHQRARAQGAGTHVPGCG